MKYLVANWKSNKSQEEVKQWAEVFKNLQSINPEITLVVCPSFLHIPLVHQLLPNLSLGAQTLSQFPDGQYTGAVSALMLSEFVKFAILGHTERRKFFGETDQIVANQVLQALDFQITPIVAVEKNNWSSQLAQFDSSHLSRMLVMYEPPEAVSSATQSHAADLVDVKQAAQLIKSSYQVKGVLYGGSIDEQNIHTYFTDKDLDGVVVGYASLDPEKFRKILTLSLG